jgi:uncharacterized membrane protein
MLIPAAIYPVYLLALLAAVFYGTGTAGMKIASSHGARTWDLAIPYAVFLLIFSFIGKLLNNDVHSQPSSIGITWTWATGFLFAIGYTAAGLSFQFDKSNLSIVACIISLATPIAVYIGWHFLKDSTHLNQPIYLIGLSLIIIGTILVVASENLTLTAPH